MAVRTYDIDDKVEVLDLDLQEWVPGVVSTVGDITTIMTERFHAVPNGPDLPLMYGILASDLDRCVRPEGPVNLRGGPQDGVCAECGRDNRWASHDALQMTGHLSHDFVLADA